MAIPLLDRRPTADIPDERAKRLGFLDSLRGMAILGVILVHSAQAAGIEKGLVHGIASYGARGVQLFFIVSAFTLLTTYGSPMNLRSFFIRRLFRIAPGFYAALIVSLLVHGFEPRFFAPDGISAHQVILTLLFLHGFSPTSVNAIVSGGWSIACEMMFYLVFPVVVVLISSLRRAVLGLTMGSIISFVFMRQIPSLIPGPAYLAQAVVSYSLIAQAPAFLAGFVVFYLLRLPGWLADTSAGLAIALLMLLSVSGTAASHFFLAIPPFALLLWSMASATIPGSTTASCAPSAGSVSACTCPTSSSSV